MKPKLTLVHSATPTVRRAHGRRSKARPIQTHYAGAYRVARSCNIPAAIVSATKRLVSGEYRRAQIWDADHNVAVIMVRRRWSVDIQTYKQGALK
jgi:hypothetical protein